MSKEKNYKFTNLNGFENQTDLSKYIKFQTDGKKHLDGMEKVTDIRLNVPIYESDTTSLNISSNKPIIAPIVAYNTTQHYLNKGWSSADASTMGQLAAKYSGDIGIDFKIDLQ